MMRYIEFKELVRKKPHEPFWISRYFWRHLTIPFSWCCTFLKIRADHITILSLISGMLGGLFFFWPTPSTFVTGLLLIQGWSFLDHVDGELARYEIMHLKRPPSLSGPYLDLLVHRWVQPFYHVGLSVSLTKLTGNWEWILLGWIAGANYFGFTKSQADSLVLRSIVSQKANSNSPEIAELVDLGHALPNQNGNKLSGIKSLINFSKSLKSWFAFPSCLFLICLVILIDAFILKMHFPLAYGIPWSATFIYLLIQAAIAIAQNIAGTWYVSTLLRRIP